VVGWITSGGYGHAVEKSLAQGYLPSALAKRFEAGLFEIEILGNRAPAIIAPEPLFDPSGAKMRS
jgi:dimethylglycine dehydrogenase